jgi:flavodoxin
MKCLIIYSSSTGNTKKVAKSIAQSVNCECIDANVLKDQTDFWESHNDIELVFLGTGIYADHVGRDLHKYLLNNLPKTPIKFALFATWIGRGNSGNSTLNKMKKFLHKHEHIVLDPYYLCYGKMLIIKGGHPNQEDLKNANIWAEKILNK